MADSDPEAEYEETLAKGRGMLAVLIALTSVVGSVLLRRQRLQPEVDWILILV